MAEALNATGETLTSGGDTWLLPEDLTPEALEEALARRFRVDPLPGYQALVTYMDSFDWRLHRAGMLLHAHGQCWTLYEENGALTLLREGPSCRQGYRAERFPEGALRAMLERVLGRRALLPVARVDLRGRLLRLYEREGRDEAPALRLAWEEQRPLAGTHEAAEPTGQCFRVARLFPLVGGDAALETARTLLRELGIVRPISPLAGFTAGCAALGRAPLDYSGKFPRALADEARDLPAGEALARIGPHLTESLRRNAPGIVDDLDTDFLHDFRVALRRTRTLISLGKDVFAPDALKSFRKGFTALGRVAGPVRDLDGLLEDEPRLLDQVARTSPEALPGLRVLFAELARQRHEAKRELTRRLTEARFLALLDDWSAFLADSSARTGLRADRPFRELVGRAFARQRRKVLAEGARLAGADRPVGDELHSLRLLCKKLRYTLEFSRALYPEDAVRAALAAFKKLQSLLGRLHDLDVRADLIRAVPASPRDAALASDAQVLIQCLAADRANVLAAFPKTFAALEQGLRALEPPA